MIILNVSGVGIAVIQTPWRRVHKQESQTIQQFIRHQ